MWLMWSRSIPVTVDELQDLGNSESQHNYFEIWHEASNAPSHHQFQIDRKGDDILLSEVMIWTAMKQEMRIHIAGNCLLIPDQLGSYGVPLCTNS